MFLIPVFITAKIEQQSLDLGCAKARTILKSYHNAYYTAVYDHGVGASRDLERKVVGGLGTLQVETFADRSM